MIEGLAAASGGLDEDLEVVLVAGLADVFVEGVGTEEPVEAGVVGALGGERMRSAISVGGSVLHQPGEARPEHLAEDHLRGGVKGRMPSVRS
ncbi:MAG: hypothetical protein R3F14_01330 [Polyangiaceae bacterium]